MAVDLLEMIRLPRSKGLLIQRSADLPDYRDTKNVYADFETSSGDPKLNSFNPWHHCKIAGLAVTADEDENVFYIPRDVLESEQGTQWAKDTFAPHRTWVNHNVKYDAQVLANQLGIVFEGRMLCTLMAAKMIDSDRYAHDLDGVCSEWLGLRKAKDILAPYLKQPNGNWKCRDYGAVPMDILGDYACEDVILNRRLHAYIVSRMPADSRDLFEMEQQVTSTLFRIERNGMHLIPQLQLKIEQMKVLNTLFNIMAPRLSELSGMELFEPHVNAQCEEILTNKFKFPVMAWTDKGLPSYDKRVLKSYKAMRKHEELIGLCLKWRELWIYNNLFLKTYLELAIDDTLYPTYNQTVRTGRMSCGKPNMQQLNKRAKGLIVPREGYKFFSTDAKQIEFRLIVHYIKNPYALKAYEENPDTDFHNWVSEMVGIPRDPAKTMNFMLGYGGGKKQTVLRLQHQADLMAELREHCENERQFDAACVQKANRVYADYHEALPELKQVSNRCAMVCRQRGYVRDIYGRHRRLPKKAAHKAFNTINQASAADMVKEAVVRVEKELPKIGARMVAVVHDEILLEVPNEVPNAEIEKTILPIVESPSVNLRVPIRWDASYSDTTWADCEA